MCSVPDGGLCAADVVDDKGDVRDAAAEVGQEQFADVVVGRDRGIERAALALHKADKPLEAVDFEGDAPHAFARGNDGVLGEHAPHGALAQCNEPEVAVCDLSAVLFAAAKEDVEVVHAALIQLGEPCFAAPRLLRIGADKDALLPERELAVPRREKGVFVAEGEQECRQKGIFAAVKKIDHSSPVSAERAASSRRGMPSEEELSKRES